MRFAKYMLLIGLIAFGWHWWRDHQGAAQQAALRSPNGFVPIVMPDGAATNTVIIFAPLNCPKEGAQRAEALSQRLTREGIPNIRSMSYSVQGGVATDEWVAAMKRTDTVMRGEIPVVLINGMGKANPSGDEIVAEYKKTRQKP